MMLLLKISRVGNAVSILLQILWSRASLTVLNLESLCMVCQIQLCSDADCNVQGAIPAHILRNAGDCRYVLILLCCSHRCQFQLLLSWRAHTTAGLTSASAEIP